MDPIKDGVKGALADAENFLDCSSVNFGDLVVLVVVHVDVQGEHDGGPLLRVVQAQHVPHLVYGYLECDDDDDHVVVIVDGDDDDDDDDDDDEDKDEVGGDADGEDEYHRQSQHKKVVLCSPYPQHVQAPVVLVKFLKMLISVKVDVPKWPGMGQFPPESVEWLFAIHVIPWRVEKKKPVPKLLPSLDSFGNENR